jgi:autotransporter-associated beta strand protein
MTDKTDTEHDARDLTLAELEDANGADGGLIKSGGGTLTLATTNTYAGTTSVAGGILADAGGTLTVGVIGH